MALNFDFTFQIVLVYFFAGVKKLDLDWVSGYSMVGLSRKWVFDPFRFIVSDQFIDLYMVHICGLVFDLSEGFLLLFEKTRPVGLFFGSMFHLMNSQMFYIGMFPWTMLATMPFFFPSDWPRVLSRKLPPFLSFLLPLKDDPKVEKRFTEETSDPELDRKQEPKSKGNDFTFLRKSFLICLASLYVLIQLFLPWSHFITQVCTVNTDFPSNTVKVVKLKSPTHFRHQMYNSIDILYIMDVDKFSFR